VKRESDELACKRFVDKKVCDLHWKQKISTFSHTSGATFFQLSLFQQQDLGPIYFWFIEDL
jgi:hypothetical protein